MMFPGPLVSLRNFTSIGDRQTSGIESRNAAFTPGTILINLAFLIVWEQPELLVHDMREGFRSLRAA